MTGEIESKRRNIFKYIYNTPKTKGNIFVSKRKLNEQYDTQKLNCYFHEAVSELLITYENDPKYKTYYSKAFSKIKMFENLSYYTGFKDYRDYMNTTNLKHFLLKLQLFSENGNVLNFEDGFFHIKTLNKKNNEDYLKLLNEAELGLIYFNKFKFYIPNVAYTYCYMECTKVKFNGEKIKTWCNETSYPNRLYPYIIKEKIPNTIPLKEYLNEIKDNNTEIFKIILQYENILSLGSLLFPEFYTNDINLDNLTVLKTEGEIPISLYFSKGELTQTGTLNTNHILYITDFSNFSMTGRAQRYVSIHRIIEKYIQKNVVPINLFEPIVPYNYNHAVNLPELLKAKDQSISKRIKYYCLYEKTDKNIEAKFLEYIGDKIKRIEQQFEFNDDVQNVVLKYIKLINILGKGKCVNYNAYLFNLFELKIKISEKIEDMNGTEKMKEDLIHTIDKMYRDIPSSNFLFNFLREVPFTEIIFFISILFFVLMSFSVYTKTMNNFIEERRFYLSYDYDYEKIAELNKETNPEYYRLWQKLVEKEEYIKNTNETVSKNIYWPLNFNGVVYENPSHFREFLLIPLVEETGDIQFKLQKDYNNLPVKDYQLSKLPEAITKFINIFSNNSLGTSFLRNVRELIMYSVDFNTYLPSRLSSSPNDSYQWCIDFFVDPEAIPYNWVFLVIFPMIAIPAYKILKGIMNMIINKETRGTIVKYFFGELKILTNDPHIRLKLGNLLSSNFMYMIKVLWKNYSNKSEKKEGQSETVENKMNNIVDSNYEKLKDVAIKTVRDIENFNLFYVK